MKIEFENNVLTAFIEGEIDHHTAPEIREKIDERIRKDKPEIVRLDYDAVSFMDSSGIGLIMGRYKLINSYSGKIEVVNVPGNMWKVIKLSGIERLGTIKMKEEKI